MTIILIGMSNTTNVQSMFSGANLFNGDVTKWQIGNVTTTMGWMFHVAHVFNGNIRYFYGSYVLRCLDV